MTRALLLVALVAVVYGAGLGQASLWDIDEAIYAEISRNMARTGDWTVPVFNGAPRFDKPPLLYWISAAAIESLGPGELAVRIGTYLFALLCVGLVFLVGRRLYGPRAGILGALVLSSTFGWFIAGRIGLMDTGLSFFVGLSIYLLLAPAGGEWRSAPADGERSFVPSLAAYAGAGAAAALGVLAKGPVALILTGGTALFHLGPRRLVRYLFNGRALVGAALFALIAMPWHLAVYRVAGTAWWESYFGYHMFSRFTQPLEEHGYGWYYYIVVLAVGFLPWTGYAVAALWNLLRSRQGAYAPRLREGGSGDSRLLVAWFAVVVVFFSLSRTKLPGYVLPAFLPLAVLTGAWCDRRLERPDAGRAFGIGLWASLAAGLLAAAGLAAMRPLVPAGYEEAHRLLFLFPGTLVGGMLLTKLLHLIFRSPKTLLYGFAGTSFAGMLLFAALLMPLIEEHKPVKPLVAAARAHFTPGTRIVSALGDRSTTFYAERPVEYVDSAAEVRSLLEGSRETLALVPQAMLGELPGVRVLAEYGQAALVAPGLTPPRAFP